MKTSLAPPSRPQITYLHSTVAPQLAALDVSPLTVSMQNGSYAHSPPRSLSPPSARSPQDQTTPSRPPPRRPSGLRKSSGPGNLSREQSPAPLNGDNSLLSENSDNSPYPGANGKVSVGKSGRVIERLMAENDKLKRELNAEITHRQELEQEQEVSRGTIESLRQENANLLQAKDSDELRIKRRDRMVEDLKAEVESERARRKDKEGQLNGLRIERDGAIEDCRRETSLAGEQAKHATSHAQVLEESHKRLGTEYRQRMRQMAVDLQKLIEERDAERSKLQKLDVVVEQMAQQLERGNKINAQMAHELQSCKAQGEQRIQQLEHDARTREDEDAKLRANVEKVMGEARWLINIGKNTASRGGLV